MKSKGRPADQAALAAWLTRLAYFWQREAEVSYSEFRYAEAAMLMHEGIEFTVKALCRHLDVEFPREHFPSMDTLVSLSEKVGGREPESKDVVLRATPFLLGYNDSKRNMARYGYEGSNSSALSPQRTFGREYCEATRSVLTPLAELLTRVQLSRRWARVPIKVGILDPRLSDDSVPCRPRWSGQCPKEAAEWSSILGSAYEVSIVRVSSLEDDLAVLVNPFGESYPERDSIKRPCYRRILSFVEDGGLLLASAGLPFFAAWDSIHGGDVELSDSHAYLPSRLAISGNMAVPSEWKKLIALEGSISSRDFGVFTTLDDGGFTEPLAREVRQAPSAPSEIGSIGGLPGSYQIFRAAKNVPTGATPILAAAHPTLGEVYPAVIVPKGRGEILLTGLNLDDGAAASLFTRSAGAICDWNRKRFAKPTAD